MRSDQISPVVIAAALNACALEPESLNSERIEQRFGSYGIDLLQYAAGVRRSSLYSLAGEIRICRTYAVVRFEEQLAPSVAAAHAEVIAGQSIGATFKSGGWKIGKETLYVGALSLDSADHPITRLMHLGDGAQLAMHAYRLGLERDSLAMDYATIVEVHHPDYLTPDELASLYADSKQTATPGPAAHDLRSLVLDAD